MFWDEDNKNYCYYMRPPIYAGHWKRRVARCESQNLLDWSFPETVIVPDELDLPEVYGMPVFKYEGYYFGLLQMYYPDSTSAIDIQPAFSDDGKAWQRLPKRETFIGLGVRHGQGADLDAGMVIADKPVVLGDELWFYYTGYREPHTDSLNRYAIDLAVAKRDRLVGRVPPPGETGVLLTRPLSWKGSSLEINAAAGNGVVQAEVLGEDGSVLKGYERTVRNGFYGDSLRWQMQWKNSKTMRSVNGSRIRLKFYLSNASIFSFCGR